MPDILDAPPKEPESPERPAAESLPPGVFPPRDEHGHYLVAVTSAGDGTISIGAAGFTTVRTCQGCGALVAGGPTRCMYCANAPETRRLRSTDLDAKPRPSMSSRHGYPVCVTSCPLFVPSPDRALYLDVCAHVADATTTGAPCAAWASDLVADQLRKMKEGCDGR